MSDYAVRVDRESSGARDQRAAAGPERALAALIAATATIALAAAATFLLPPALRITRYEIAGNSTMTREEVLSAALIHEKEYFFSLDASRVKAAVMADPRVAAASVTKSFPNSMRIALRERVAVVVALVSMEGRAVAVCLDAEGVAFAEASPSQAASVPVLSGLRFEGFRLGTRLPSELCSLVSSLGSIQATEPALLSAFSEIRVVSRGGPDATAVAATELLLYPINQRIPVRAGATLDAPTLRSIILVLDVLGTKGMADSVREIDFRTGTVVYRSKEGPTG
jgi:hypothetical protein